MSELHPLARLPEEWSEWAKEQGESAFRGRQIFRWLHKQGVFEPEQMKNLSNGVRQKLADLSCPLEVEHVNRSQDGTRKLLCRTPEGALVECVLIPMTTHADGERYERDDTQEGGAPSAVQDKPERVTLCISTQVGCAMGCVFCASGQAGLKRGLKAEEVLAQILLAKRYLEPQEQLRNLVFMGMGEPLHHYDQTARALRLIGQEEGLSIGPRRITVSTVGLVPGIQKLGRDFDGKVGLAISLHAPNQELRSQIIPMNERYPLRELLNALHEYPLPKRRRITIEYTLIRDLNDQPEHARELADCLKGLRVKVNLIPMNPIEASDLQEPREASVDRFQEELANRRISCSVRKRRGDDVAAACGQLALQQAAPGTNRPATAEAALVQLTTK